MNAVEEVAQKKLISAQIPIELYARIRAIAGAEGRSMSALVQELLEGYARVNSHKNRPSRGAR
jgi:predicted DNA-binding protein